MQEINDLKQEIRELQKKNEDLHNQCLEWLHNYTASVPCFIDANENINFEYGGLGAITKQRRHPLDIQCALVYVHKHTPLTEYPNSTSKEYTEIETLKFEILKLNKALEEWRDIRRKMTDDLRTENKKLKADISILSQQLNKMQYLHDSHDRS